MDGGIPFFLVAALVGIGCYFLPRTVPKPQIVGMDLGTTYSGVGVFEIGTGKVHIVPNKNGNQVIPSWVAFTDKGVLVGDDAREQDLLNPENTVYGMKRFIGREWSEEMINETRLLPFHLVNNHSAPCVKPTFESYTNQLYSPQHIGSFILSSLRRSAEEYIGTTIKRVVLAVPVDFDDAQINATKEAAGLAGMTVERVITEPTAAAMAYGLHEVSKQQDILVYDMGGGTLDVSLMSCSSGHFSVLAVDGDNNLGGEDVNRAVMDAVAEQMRTQDDFDVESDKTQLQQLRDNVESAKRQLSVDEWVLFNHMDEGRNYKYEMNLTRSLFDEMCKPLFDKLTTPIAKVFQKSGMKKEDIDSIVLVGGSTQIPFVRDVIADFFEGRIVPYLKVPPEQAVTIGTALQAAIIGHYWPLPTSATEDWDLIRAMRHGNVEEDGQEEWDHDSEAEEVNDAEIADL